MKKLLCLILTAVMLLSALSVCTSAFISEADAAVKIGDADKDGSVNTKDVYFIKTTVAGYDTDATIAAGDADDDGKLTSKDAYRLKLLFAGNISSLSDSTAPIKRLKIAGYDISEFSISTPDESVRLKVENEAGKKLSEFIEEATGVEVEKDPDVPKAHQFIIRPDASLGTEGIDIEVKNGNVYISGGTVRGCYYAVYDFLERYLGYVFIDKDNVFLNSNESVYIKDGSHYRHIPVFKDRDSQTYSYGDDYEVSGKQKVIEAACRLKINSWKNRGSLERYDRYGYAVGYVGSAHTYSDYAPSYCKDNNSFICFTASGPYNEMVTNVLAKIADLKERGRNCERISVSPMDNWNYCTCSNCSAYYRSGKSVMGAQLRFTNKIADAVAKLYPDVHIMTTAYIMARKPPIDVVPRDNVDVLFCWAGCNNHPFDGSKCFEEGNRMYMSNITESQYFERWCELCDVVYVWIYCGFYVSPLAEPSFVNNIRGDLRYLAEHGAYGIYCEGYYNYGEEVDDFGDGNCFDQLTMYMLARCLWDPYMSEEDFNNYENEFLRYQYGEGWESVRRAIEINEEATDALNACWANNCDITFDCISLDYLAANAETLYSLADTAVSKAKTAEEIKNTEHFAAHVYYLALCSTDSQKTSSAYKTRYTKLYNWVKKYNMTDCDGYPINASSSVKNPYYWNSWASSMGWHRTKDATDIMKKYG